MSGIDVLPFWNTAPNQNRERVLRDAKWWRTAHCAQNNCNLRYKPGDKLGYCKSHDRFEELEKAHWWWTPHCPSDGTNIRYSPGDTEANCTACGERLSLVSMKFSGQAL